MGAFYTKLRYVGDEERPAAGPWDWTIVEIETGHEMIREAATRAEAEAAMAAELGRLLA